MKISEKAWHLRYVRALDRWGELLNGHLNGIHREYVPYVPKNLCTYFWIVVLIGPMMGAFSLIAMIAILLKWIVVWLVMAIAHGIVWALNKWDESREKKAETGEAPKVNLLWAFLKAKKRKVCPIIEVVK